MKCYKHPSDDAVGVCSKCGKGVCTVCARTVADKILCEDCSPYRVKSPRRRQYILIGIALGLLGAVNIVLIGAYTASFFITLGTVWPGSFKIEPYIVGIVTAVVAATLLIGGYQMWRGRLRKGGIINLGAGIAIALIYSYFVLSRPKVRYLVEFGVAGPLLCIPAVLSGILGLIWGRFFEGER